jgi:hypothetical protein
MDQSSGQMVRSVIPSDVTNEPAGSPRAPPETAGLPELQFAPHRNMRAGFRRTHACVVSKDL